VAIALITNTGQGSTTSNGFTTTAIDTTGANFLVLSLVTGISSGAISDSNGNTWSPLTQYSDGFGDRYCQLFYVANATVGAGHTFSVTGIANFPSLFIAAFSGVASSPFDVENGNTNAVNTSVQPGSITPGANNELIITGLQYSDSSTPTVNSSFTITDFLPGGVTFGQEGGALAYLIQTTATAENPTWSWTSNSNNTAVIASFQASGGAADVLMPQIWL